MPKSLDEIMNDAAVKNGLDPAWFKRVGQVESGLNPGARTGSYRGLFQQSPAEFAAHGGRGNIYDPEQNANSAAVKFAKERDAFTQKYGRPPTPTEAYMIHQQGAGGLDAHLANPDQPAWKSMAGTREGREKGEGWAKAAIWGNVPDQLKRQFGSVDNVTSADFVNRVWAPKIEGRTGETATAGAPVAAAPAASAGLGYRPALAEERSLAALPSGLSFGQMPSGQLPAGVPVAQVPIQAGLGLLARYGRG